MKNQISKLFFTLISLLLITSCKPKAELNYMKNIDELTTEVSLANARTSSTIQPGDQLGILISADDMDVVDPFNQNSMLVENAYNSTPRSNYNPRGANSSLPTYTVKPDGTIDFPILGILDTKEKTVEEFSNYIKQRMTKYVLKPVVVNIKTLNYKVTVLGQVNNPGTYIITDSNATLLSALGLAGDLSKYGLRDNVLVVRNENGQITKTRIDLTKADYLDFHMKQNDVIYVSGNETVSKTSRLDPNAGIYISVASIVVTILALVFKK